MLESLRTERAKMRKALKLATGALAFYADPSVYMVRHSNPLKTSVVTIDGGLLARMTLDDLATHLDDGAQCDPRRCHLRADDDD